MANKMREIKVEKLTLNIGAGKDQDKLEKGMKLIEYITGTKPVKTITKKRIPNWGLRPGLPIGCKLTIRSLQKNELIKRFIEGRESKLKLSQFDDNGNVSFGVHEYINIPGVKYHPEIGIMGLQISITLIRAGYRVGKRRLLNTKIPQKQRVSKQEALDFMKQNFGVEIDE